ncbi:MAG: hypothetical protein ACKO1V_05735, partial [Cyanobium sp.]
CHGAMFDAEQGIISIRAADALTLQFNQGPQLRKVELRCTLMLGDDPAVRFLWRSVHKRDCN